MAVLLKLKMLSIRFFILAIFVCLNLHSLAAFGAGGEKFYGYWYFGHNDGIDIGNKNIRSEYDNFRAEHPNVKQDGINSRWDTDTKIVGYAHKSNGHYLGGMVAIGGYRPKTSSSELMDILISRLYANYLLFLFSNSKGLFIELSSGIVMAGYEKKRVDEVTSTSSRSRQEYGYGASATLGYEFKFVSWTKYNFGLNIQGGYNFAHSTALGNVTWNDYGAAVSFSF